MFISGKAIMSALRKGSIGINPIILRFSLPAINDGVSIRILENTANHLPCPLGQGLKRKNKI